MRCDEAAKRNAVPVPAAQYGNQKSGDSYRYWDNIALNPPDGGVRSDISLQFQPTSRKYVQFLYLANNKTNGFLANEGANLLDAWLNTGMAEPYTMATTTWVSPTLTATATQTVNP